MPLPAARPAWVEMSSDRLFARRIVRLAITSAIVLGLIWYLAERKAGATPWIGASLLGGWILMPSILALSLKRPRLRYALVVPSTLVTVGLLAICMTSLPADAVARSGWLLATIGIVLGGVLGIWFWFRWIPVPPAMADPFSAPRWTLIAIHVLLIVAGIGLVALSPSR